MPTPPPEVLSTPARELRRAVELVERHAPAAFANDIAEIRRRIGWILAGLDNTTTCKHCDRSFNECRVADAALGPTHDHATGDRVHDRPGLECGAFRQAVKI